MKKVAIFDVDGTLFRSSLLIKLVEGFIEDGVFPQAAQDGYLDQLTAWQDRAGTYHAYIMAVVDVFHNNLQGVPYTAFRATSERVVDEAKDHVYRYTRDLVRDLKSKGFYLLAISHSPKGILDDFCKTVGFDKVYGRFYELGPTERFTGEMVDRHIIENKANIVRRVVTKEGLTLEQSIGVGDTESDIPFLELVERPICFNPNSELYAWAKRTGAEVVVERKDVVYTIQ
jgi:HAD superfamily hydrolase (TIGR01490 family)